jgi:hypothetical protein
MFGGAPSGVHDLKEAGRVLPACCCLLAQNVVGGTPPAYFSFFEFREGVLCTKKKSENFFFVRLSAMIYVP